MFCHGCSEESTYWMEISVFIQYYWVHIPGNEEYSMHRELVAWSGTDSDGWLVSAIRSISKYEQLLNSKINVKHASFRGLINTERSSRWRNNNKEHCRKGAYEQVWTSLSSIVVVETSVIWVLQKKIWIWYSYSEQFRYFSSSVFRNLV